MNLSAHRVTTYMHSERCAFWRYGLRLHRKAEAASLKRGAELHEQAAAKALGQCELVVSLDGLADAVEQTIGQQEVIMVEEECTYPLRPGAHWLGITDLVLRDRDGLIHIHDYKFPGKRCDTSYYSGPVSNSLQMTGYYWLGTKLWGDDFSSLVVDAWSTRDGSHGSFAISRDDWQLSEFEQQMRAWSVLIERLEDPMAYWVDRYARGIECWDDPDFDLCFPMRYNGEDWCEYQDLNRAPPEFRAVIIKEMYDAVEPTAEEYA